MIQGASGVAILSALRHAFRGHEEKKS